MMTATDTQAREERNAYKREWYRENKHKHAKHQIKYWKKKLAEYEAESDEQVEATN